MLQPQRQEQILEILRKEMTIRGSRLIELLGVSEIGNDHAPYITPFLPIISV